MTELFGSLMVIAALFIVLYYLRDIIASILHRIKFSNLNYMYGLSKHDLLYYHHASSPKKKSSKRSRKLQAQSELDRTQVVDRVGDVTIRYQPLAASSEPVASPGQIFNPPEVMETVALLQDLNLRDLPDVPETTPLTSSATRDDHFDEEVLAEIDLFKDLKLQTQPTTSPNQQAVTPALNPVPPGMSTVTDNKLKSSPRIHHAAGTGKSMPATPPHPQRGFKESVIKNIDHDDNQSIRSELAAKTVKSEGSSPKSRPSIDKSNSQTLAGNANQPLRPKPSAQPVLSAEPKSNMRPRANEPTAERLDRPPNKLAQPKPASHAVKPAEPKTKPRPPIDEPIIEKVAGGTNRRMPFEPSAHTVQPGELKAQGRRPVDEPIAKKMAGEGNQQMRSEPPAKKMPLTRPKFRPGRKTDRQFRPAILPRKPGIIPSEPDQPGPAPLMPPNSLSSNQAKEKVRRDEKAEILSELSISKQSTTMPAEPPRRSVERGIEKRELDQAGQASQAPSMSGATLRPVPTRSQPRTSEKMPENIDRVPQASVSPETPVTKSRPIVTLVESPHQAGEPNAEDIFIFEDMTIHLSSSPMESQPLSTAEETPDRLIRAGAEDIITVETVAEESAPSEAPSAPIPNPEPVAPPPDVKGNPATSHAQTPKDDSPPLAMKINPAVATEQTDRPFDKKSRVDNDFQKSEEARSTEPIAKPKPIEKIIPTAHQTGPAKATDRLRGEAEIAGQKPARLEKLSNLIPEHSRLRPPESSEKDINLFEGLSARLKQSKAPSLEIPVQFRNQAGKLDKADVENLLKNYDFHDAVINPGGKGLPHHYRAIELSGDEIIIDEATNLIWQQHGSSEDMTIDQARQWLEQLNRDSHAGFQDWRFPTLEEAMSLIEPAKKNDDLFIDPVFNKTQELIWTGDFLSDPSQMWIVSLKSGFCSLSSPDSKGYLRAVRQDENLSSSLII